MIWRAFFQCLSHHLPIGIIGFGRTSLENGDAEAVLKIVSTKHIRNNTLLTAMGSLKRRSLFKALIASSSLVSRSKSVTCKFCARRVGSLLLGITAILRCVDQRSRT